MGGREHRQSRGILLSLFSLVDIDVEQGGEDEQQSTSTERSGQGEDDVQLRNGESHNQTENRPDEGLQNTAKIGSLRLEEHLIDGDERGEGEDGVGEEGHEGVGDLHDIQIPHLHVGEVAEKTALSFAAEGKVTADADEEVNEGAGDEGDAVHAIHLLQLVGELGLGGELELSGHLRNVHVGAETGEEHGDGGTEISEILREPYIVQRLYVNE